jgi:FtsH-binding integral membrane protein
MSITNGVLTLIPPPEGYEVDFDNPQRKETTIRQIYWTFGSGLLIAFAFLSQSIYVKLFIRKKFDIELGLILSSWALGIVVQVGLVSKLCQK